MKDLQDLWSEIREKPLGDNEFRAILDRKSIFEIERFKRLLLIELYISWGLAIVILVIHGHVGMEVVAMTCVTIFVGSVLNIITLRKIKKLQLLDDVRSFLENVLRVLKAFVTGFILTIQIIGIFVITAYKILKHGHIPWGDWLMSEQGISIIMIFLSIEVVLLSYAWVFYVRRIQSLEKILREMGE